MSSSYPCFILLYFIFKHALRFQFECQFDGWLSSSSARGIFVRKFRGPILPMCKIYLKIGRRCWTMGAYYVQPAFYSFLCRLPRLLSQYSFHSSLPSVGRTVICLFFGGILFVGVFLYGSLLFVSFFVGSFCSCSRIMIIIILIILITTTTMVDQSA